MASGKLVLQNNGIASRFLQQNLSPKEAKIVQEYLQLPQMDQ